MKITMFPSNMCISLAENTSIEIMERYFSAAQSIKAVKKMAKEDGATCLIVRNPMAKKEKIDKIVIWRETK